MRFLALITALLMGTVFAQGDARPASACSAGPDFDQIDAFDWIAAGRLTGWEIAGDIPPGDNKGASPFTPLRVTMAVDQTFKGVLPPVVTIVDKASLRVTDTEPHYQWLGASGSCGAFSEDPTGRYVVIGLDRDGAEYRSHIFGWFFYGDDPAGAEYATAVQRLGERGMIVLPTSGGPPGGARPSPDWIIAGATLLILGSIVVTRSVWPRR